MSAAVEGRIRVERTARYFRLDHSAAGASGPTWLLLHGYGEQADRFLEGTRGILGQGAGRLIAPEGLSRFYTKGGTGGVGSSWMTSLIREEEIGEYLAMIDAVLDDCRVPPGDPLHVLGFSQGGATAMRYALRSGRDIRRLVLWGAGFEEEELRQWSGGIDRIGEVVLVTGEQDRVVRRDVSERTSGVIGSLGGTVRLLSHRGGHEIDVGLLEELGRVSSVEQ